MQGLKYLGIGAHRKAYIWEHRGVHIWEHRGRHIWEHIDIYLWKYIYESTHGKANRNIYINKNIYIKICICEHMEDT